MSNLDHDSGRLEVGKKPPHEQQAKLKILA
jgi:hypothetical protein